MIIIVGWHKKMNSTYTGITTNNINNINFSIEDNEVCLIMGPNGSGKSSLAIDTVYSISNDELSQLLNKKDYISNYTIVNYENINPSICLQQVNYNKNPRSTIATYFGLDVFFKQLFSITNQVPSNIFQFNTYRNACKTCSGTGIEYGIYENSIIDYHTKLSDLPFKNWNSSYKEFYQKILCHYCKELLIDIKLTFSSLTPLQQDQLLTGISVNKYKIEFNAGGRKRVKTAKYIGPIAELKMLLKNKKLTKGLRKNFIEQKCSDCKGLRFSHKVLKYKVIDKSIGELYSMEISNLFTWITKNQSQTENNKISNIIFKKIAAFLKNFTNLNLGYLDLNRSIPSLSGGELQRLRIAKATMSPFYDFLYILDEPSAGLHPFEWNTIFTFIENLKKNNKVIIIEHNESFKKFADKIIYLGPCGGKNGGNLVDEPIIKSKESKYKFFKSNKKCSIKNENYNNIKNLSIDFPLETIIGVCGVSGSGKTSFLKGILLKYIDQAIFFDQSPIRGNTYSIVATAIGVFDQFRQFLANENNIDASFFKYTDKGGCKKCSGKGYIINDNSYVNEKIICPKCEGKRFSSDVLTKYKFNSLNIYELLNLSIDEIIEIIPNIHTPQELYLLQELGLGYLNLFQEISTLSGGESQRIKLIKNFSKNKNKKCFIFDEPFEGIDKPTIYKLIDFFYKLVANGNTIIFSEHTPIAIHYTSYVIEFGPKAGTSGGEIIAFGEINDFKKNKKSIFSRYL